MSIAGVGVDAGKLYSRDGRVKKCIDGMYSTSRYPIDSIYTCMGS
jgi:hypothetical protein